MHAYDINKSRTHGVLMPDRINEMHFDIASLFKFNPVIDIQFIEQMVHPARGYLNHLASGITAEELIKLYETLLVATNEKMIGQTILAHKISAYAFWNLIDKKSRGWLSLSEYLALLRTVRFEKINSAQDIHKAFTNHYKDFTLEKLAASNAAFAFEPFKNIFLQRNL